MLKLNSASPKYESNDCCQIKGNRSESLNKPPAGGPHVLTVKGVNSLTISDVLVGEVWLCSGQSNMRMSVSSAMKYEQERATANLPQIRHFKTANRAIGEADNIHPKNKQDVGRRLALWALVKVYGKPGVPCGPLYRSMTRKGDAIIIHFDHIGRGLIAKGNKLAGFAVAGADKQFAWADAKIVGETVVVSSPRVKDPAAVRYAWAPNPECNLYNTAGLPASPFRTDNWPIQIDAGRW